MCGCEAHRLLVDCTCNCDHSGDRISQWKARALAAEDALERVSTARAEALREAAHEIEFLSIPPKDLIGDEAVGEAIGLLRAANVLRARADAEEDK
jgi:hypothetical protein